jgi:hypothetical protein
MIWGLNLNAFVDLGPDMCGAGAVGMNDDCGDQDYPMDFPCLGEGPKNHEVCMWFVG